MNFIVTGAVSLLIIVLVGLFYMYIGRRKETVSSRTPPPRNKEHEKDFNEALGHYIHNLKSPLSTALLAIDNLEVMLKRQFEQLEIDRVLDDARLSLQETNRKIQELALLTGRPVSGQDTINLNDLIHSLLASDAAFSGIKILNSSANITLRTDEQAFALALEKLIRFSLKNKERGVPLCIDLTAVENVKSANTPPPAVRFRLFTENQPDSGTIPETAIKEPDSDESSELFFIEHFLFNNAALLSGGITTGGAICWEILFNENGTQNDGTNSFN